MAVVASYIKKIIKLRFFEYRAKRALLQTKDFCIYLPYFLRRCATYHFSCYPLSSEANIAYPFSAVIWMLIFYADNILSASILSLTQPRDHYLLQMARAEASSASTSSGASAR